MKTIYLPKLYKWQQSVFEYLNCEYGSNKRVVIKSFRQGSGKTFLTEILLISFALKKKCDSIFITPVLKQAAQTFNDITTSCKDLIKSANRSSYEITFCNDSRIFFRSAESDDSIRGLTCSGIMICDEASFIKDIFIYKALPLVKVHKAPIVLVSTPLVSEGFFWSACNSTDWKLFDWSVYVNECFTEEELDFYKRTYSPQAYQTEILGNFIASGSGLYFRKIKEAILTEEASKESVWIGVDCSSSENGDLTVVSAFNEKNQQIALFTENQLSPVDRVKWIADRIRFISKSGNIRQITVETNSMGMTYKDLLQRELNTKITGWVTTNKSKRDIIENLQQLLENEQVKFLNDSGMIRELQSFECTIHKNGLITYQGKNSTDDRVMASAIALWSIKKSFGNYNIK